MLLFISLSSKLLGLSRQTAKHLLANMVAKGFPPHLHLSPGFCSPCGSPVPVAGWCYSFLVVFLLFFFLSSISISPSLDLWNSGRGKRFKHWENLPKIDREENQNKPWFWTVTKIHKRGHVPIYTSQLSDTRWLSDGNWSDYMSTPTHTLLTALLRTSPSLKSQRQVTLQMGINHSCSHRGSWETNNCSHFPHVTSFTSMV